MSSPKVKLLALVLVTVLTVATLGSTSTGYFTDQEVVEGDAKMPKKPSADAAAGDTDVNSNTIQTNETELTSSGDIGNDIVIKEGTAVELTGENSTDDTGIDSYEWDLDEDGTYETTGVSQEQTYEDNGEYTVALRVTDTTGLTDTANATVTVENVPPTAKVDGAENGQAGTAIEFDASNSSDPGADKLSYNWTFGDGTSAGVSSPTHTYADEGTYVVNLTVRDDDGGVDEATMTVTVENAAPTAVTGPDSSVIVGEQFEFDGTDSFDGDSDELQYKWDVDGDGKFEKSGVAPNHTYNSTGKYNVTLRVTDGDGGSDTDTVTITVNNVSPTADAGPDQTVSTGETVTFDGTGSSDPGTDTLSYEWDVDDDGVYEKTGKTPSHTFNSEGTKTVTLRVSDSDGGSDTDTMTVTVENVAPTADAGTDQTVKAGETVTFDGTGSTKGDPSDSLSYEWDIDNDGTYEKSGATPSHTYTNDGAYTITLRVTDGDGGSATDTTTVTVENTALTADAGTDQTVNVDETVDFDGTGSSGPDGDTLGYEWDIDNDGTYEKTGKTPNYTYNSEGTRTVTLRVTDGNGGSDTDTMTVTVENTAPTADAGSDQTVNESESFSFDGTGSSQGDSSDSLSYEWDLDNDTTYEKTGATPTHTYSDDGTKTVTLRVTDGDGGSDTDTMTVSVENVAPTADAGSDQTVSTGETVTFDGTGSSDPGADTLSYEWDVDDDGTYEKSGATPSHTYTNDGAHTITLRVTDGDGGSATDTMTVTVSNSAPIADAGSDLTVDEGQSFGLDGTGSNDSDGTVSSFEWDVDDDGAYEKSDATPIHTYNDDGIRTVTLRVTDDDGATDTDTVTVTVNNLSPTADAGSDQTVTTGETVTFYGTGSSDPGADTLSYEWDVDDDGTYEKSGATPTHTYNDDGTYTVTVRVTDGDGGSATDTMTVTVSNSDPIADAGTDQTVEVGETVQFDGTGSSDADGDSLSYEWDFGDGSTATGATPTHTYSSEGLFTVTLTVTDEHNATDTDTVTIDATSLTSETLASSVSSPSWPVRSNT